MEKKLNKKQVLLRRLEAIKELPKDATFAECQIAMLKVTVATK